MESVSAKKKAIRFINSLPDEISIEEIIYRLYLDQDIEKAQQQLKDGKGYTQEEIKELSKKW
jgi:hypothetical protein